jgi:hypothetical protein
MSDMGPTAKDIIANQIIRSGETLMLALEPLTNDEFFGCLETGFSAAWSVGHLACVADLFSSWLDIKPKMFGDSFHDVFNETDINGWEPQTTSKAARVDRDTFPKEMLLHNFRHAVIKALGVLDKFDTGRWYVKGIASVPSLITAGEVWELLAVHIYWHCGELAGSMPRFFGTYTLNILPHHFYRRVP